MSRFVRGLLCPNLDACVPERVVNKRDEYVLAANDIGMGHILVGLVREHQRAGAVAHAIAVTRLAGNDGGIGAAGKEADGRVRVLAIA